MGRVRKGILPVVVEVEATTDGGTTMAVAPLPVLKTALVELARVPSGVVDVTSFRDSTQHSLSQ